MAPIAGERLANRSHASLPAAEPPGTPAAKAVARGEAESLTNPSLLQRKDANRLVTPHEVGVVRGHEDRRTAPVDRPEQLEHPARGARIQVSGGFVGEKDERFRGQRPRHGHPLAFPTGQFGRPRPCPRPEPDVAQQTLNPTLDLALRRPDHLEREGHVLGSREPLQQLEVLKHEPHTAPQLRHIPPPDPLRAVARDDDFPRAWGAPGSGSGRGSSTCRRPKVP